MILLTFLLAISTAQAFDSWENRCNGSWTPPTTIVNTTLRLEELRILMKEENISAYIVPSVDAHNSEYVAEHDKRRQFISGFSGSMGDAVVTLENAALWVDSRYYIAAGDQLDCNWLLMPTGISSTPTIDSWISEQLKPGDKVSADATLLTYSAWESRRQLLEKNNISLVVTTDNLVDIVWGEQQPPYPDEPVTILGLEYAGVSWQDKLATLRDDAKKDGADTLILSALDEVAWSLNLRGGDIPFTPVFRSYLVLQSNKTILYMPIDKLSSEIEEYLNANATDDNNSVRIRDYAEIWADLETIGNESQKIGVPDASYLLQAMLPSNKITAMKSPALYRKNVKNDIEARGLFNAHVKDAVALCVFYARLTKSLAAGENWTELSAAAALDELRAKQPLSRGISFETISAVGINAALPHYEPSISTDRALTTTELFLVDSGGQYLDGTTDVTRTVHFGTPKEEEILVYTKLLEGCIDVVTTIFPEGYTITQLDFIIRRPLFSLGLNFGHGTTHGIGHYLSVHEQANTTFTPSFFGSQEPGYYKENDFGMRLENIVTVTRVDTFSGEPNWLSFEPVTLVPYEPKLINATLLTDRHITWLNKYNEDIRTIVGAEMLRQGYNEEHQWLLDNTKPFER